MKGYINTSFNVTEGLKTRANKTGIKFDAIHDFSASMRNSSIPPKFKVLSHDQTVTEYLEYPFQHDQYYENTINTFYRFVFVYHLFMIEQVTPFQCQNLILIIK